MAHVPNWKFLEHKIAKLFGTSRTPLSGGNSRHTRSDTLHPDFFVSCKYSQTCAIQTLFVEENTKAVKEDKIPVLALQRARANNSLICVSHLDLVEFCVTFLRSKGFIVRRKK